MTAPNTSRCADAVVIGDLDACAFLQAPVTIAYGNYKNDKQFRNSTPGTGRQFVESLCTFARGAKDGQCILQGTTVAPSKAACGVRRLKTNMLSNHVIMLDDDTGAPIEETVTKIQALDLFAVVWTTHSHGKETTAVNETALHKWMRQERRGDTALLTADDIAAFLHATKNTRLDIFKGATLEGRKHIEGGVHYVLRHEPMARMRILLWLNKPYAFADRPGLAHAQAMDDWSARYAEVAQKIGVAYDKSCVDPSRLMYVPRIAPDAVIGDGPLEHQIIVIAGKPFDLDAVEVTKDKPRTAGRTGAGTSSGTRRQHQTPWLATELRRSQGRVRAADLVRDFCDDYQEKGEGKVTATCPNPHGSGVNKPDDLLAMNYADAENGVFVFKCHLHDTCRELNGGDLLDLFIQDRGITREDFLEYLDGRSGLPDGFRIEDDLICGFRKMQKVGDDEVPVFDRVCSLLDVTGFTRDELAGKWGREIAFKDKDGNDKRNVVTSELLYGDGSTLFTELGSAGLWIGEDKWARGKFKQLLNSWHTNERITEFSKAGWHGHGYMSPCGEVIGLNDGVYRLRDGVGVVDVDKGGTLDGWKAGVGHAVWAGDTPQYAFGCMTGVAGALVQLADFDTIGFHFLGESGKGKTISQCCGASCVANPKPDKGVLITARGTDNALEGKFEKGNGSSVHLDEAKTGSAKIMELLIFMAASGVGKARMRQDTTLRVAKSWSTCWTFSSEKSLAAILGSVDGELVTGGVVRLMTVPLEICPDIGKDRADAIKEAARSNYGWALPVFVQEVMSQGLHTDRAQLLDRINTYADQLPATNVAAKRARQVFGLMWVVGELMQACGLAPEDADVERVIRWAWDGYVDTAELLDPKAKNIQALETYLRSNIGVTVFKCRPGPDDPRQHREVVAWYDASTVYVRADKIEGLTGVTLSRNELASALAAAGLLDERATAAKRTTYPYVPGQGRVPHYRLNLALGAETVIEMMARGVHPHLAAALAAGA